MKKLLASFILLISVSGIAQQNILEETSWNCNSNIFEVKDQKSYTFTKSGELDNNSFHWGYSIRFLKDGSFATNYSAPCGNDCFTSLSGTYSFIDEGVVVIYVESINRNGFCQLESEEPKTTYGKYKVTLSENGATLNFTKLN